ncbi:glutamine synthetase [Aestuariivirga sp.]|uniref:glutamine synthetase n=1 Tax=Aestuariivirga sp. TaxID=2650926 RepID=UPI0039E58EED
MPKAPSPTAPAPLTALTIMDYAGIARGRSVTRASFDASKGAKTCGWVPANMSLTSYDIIADPNPWGSAGDLRLIADRAARYTCWPAGAATPLDLVMSDIVETDGSPWVCCPRSLLKRALAEFKKETGTEFIASFEQEFQVLGANWPPAPSFAVSALRRADPFGPDIVAALTKAGIEPEVFVAEYGRDQFEITTPPANGLVAADRALVIREVIREIAMRRGWRASFSPKTAVNGVGNGVHIHFSFAGANGKPAAFDAKGPGRMSKLAGAFAAGVLKHLPALIAFTASSPISGLRLKPHNWSSSYTWLGERDRESSLRICPTVSIGGKDPAKQYNIEFRAADATASPHLSLAVLILAGLEGIRAKLPAPPIFSGDPEALSAEERSKLGLVRLPDTLEAALDCLAADKTVSGWFAPVTLETYIGMKRMELKLSDGQSPDELCQRYATIY